MSQLSKIVKEANKLDLTVATHSMWLDGLETVIDAGVTSIEHCPTYLGGIIPDLIKATDLQNIHFVIKGGTVVKPNCNNSGFSV